MRSRLLIESDAIARPGSFLEYGTLASPISHIEDGGEQDKIETTLYDLEVEKATNARDVNALDMVEAFEAEMQQFEEGDHVVLNTDTLRLLKEQKGCGWKLLMKYEGPFEILEKKHMNRADFDELVEYDIKEIIAKSWRKGRGGRRILLYCVRYTGYGPEHDLWSTSEDLTKVPIILRKWNKAKEAKRKENLLERCRRTRGGKVTI
ncbi:hypothetical protein DXG01_002837 [Tephrocybe rancida]|nr:hypothetical protein DXG01_002837 [Tephrocybe rancida]